MLYEVKDYVEHDRYIHKNTKEKVVAFEGKDLISLFLRGKYEVLTFAGRVLKLSPNSEKILLKSKLSFPEYIEVELDEQVIHNGDKVVYFDNGTLRVFSKNTFSKYYEKEFNESDIKISSKGILRVNEKTYLNLNNYSDITIDENVITLESEKTVTIEEGVSKHFDKIKELIKNYVEE